MSCEHSDSQPCNSVFEICGNSNMWKDWKISQSHTLLDFSWESFTPIMQDYLGKIEGKIYLRTEIHLLCCNHVRAQADKGEKKGEYWAYQAIVTLVLRPYHFWSHSTSSGSVSNFPLTRLADWKAGILSLFSKDFAIQLWEATRTQD